MALSVNYGFNVHNETLVIDIALCSMSSTTTRPTTGAKKRPASAGRVRPRPGRKSSRPVSAGRARGSQQQRSRSASGRRPLSAGNARGGNRARRPVSAGRERPSAGGGRVSFDDYSGPGALGISGGPGITGLASQLPRPPEAMLFPADDGAGGGFFPDGAAFLGGSDRDVGGPGASNSAAPDVYAAAAVASSFTAQPFATASVSSTATAASSRLPSDDLVTTVGEVFFSSGNSYRGELVDGLMHGSGVYTWADKSRYVGEFQANEIQGSGEKTWKQGLRKYAGQWKDGLFHGKGELTWEGRTEESYSGSFRKGFFHGSGRRRWGSGDTYEGGWKGGQRDGRGILHLARPVLGDGSTPDLQQVYAMEYDGMWSLDDFHGRGRCVWSDGASYRGEWLAGQMHGEGCLTDKRGWVYDGTFAEGLPEGRGSLHPPPGAPDPAHAATDAAAGSPTIDWGHTGGSAVPGDGGPVVVEGTWSAGVPHGHCRAVWSNGQAFDGEWSHGLVCGRGCLHYPPPMARGSSDALARPGPAVQGSGAGPPGKARGLRQTYRVLEASPGRRRKTRAGRLPATTAAMPPPLQPPPPLPPTPPTPPTPPPPRPCKCTWHGGRSGIIACMAWAR